MILIRQIAQRIKQTFKFIYAALIFHGIRFLFSKKKKRISSDIGFTKLKISIPYGNGWAEVSLVSGKGDERRVHAVSKRIQLIDPYWLRHEDEMKASDLLYRVYLSLLTTKEGAVVENQVVEDIVELFRKEDIR